VAQTASVRRRFYRFFQYVQLDGTLAARVVVELLGLGGKSWVLAIDRTNWDFGKTTINILIICVLQKQMRGGCKDGNRRGKYPNMKFEFLGYCFRPRTTRNRKRNEVFTGFEPQVSASSLKSMRQKIRELKLRKRTQIRLADIARKINPILQGWLNYYGRYNPTVMYPMWGYVNVTLVAWAMQKYKRYAGGKTQAGRMIAAITIKRPRLFVHWHQRKAGTFA
jgi:hypothetical protein